LLFLMWWRWSG